MPLDSRKVAHIEANRARIREGRTETVVLVSGTGPVTYQAITDCLWQDFGQVPAGVANRAGAVTRKPWDALLVLPGNTSFPARLTLIARTSTASAAAVRQAERYRVLDRIRIGLGVGATGPGNRWQVKLRRLK